MEEKRLAQMMSISECEWLCFECFVGHRLTNASEHTARLHQESQRMEERLRILRQVMAVEKVQRE